MGLFTKYCPVCGDKLEKTGYAFPHPQWRCPNCIKQNKEKKKRKALEKRVNQLEQKLEKNETTEDA